MLAVVAVVVVSEVAAVVGFCLLCHKQWDFMLLVVVKFKVLMWIALVVVAVVVAVAVVAVVVVAVVVIAVVAVAVVAAVVAVVVVVGTGVCNKNDPVSRVVFNHSFYFYNC